MEQTVIDGIAALLRTAVRRTTPKRIDEAHSAMSAVCPGCDHTVTSRRVLVLMCACGTLRLEVDYTSNDVFVIALAHHQKKGNGNGDAQIWLRDGR